MKKNKPKKLISTVSFKNIIKDVLLKILESALLGLFTGIFLYLGSITINNNLKIDKVDIEYKYDAIGKALDGRMIPFSITEDDVVSGYENVSNRFFAPVYDISIKGRGKIQKIYYFYKYDYTEDGKDEFNVTKVILKDSPFFDIKRIWSVSPSDFILKLNLYYKKEDYLNRVYVALKDDDSENYKILLMVIPKSENVEDIILLDEDDIFRTVDYASENEDEKTRRYLSQQSDYIKNELFYIYDQLNKLD